LNWRGRYIYPDEAFHVALDPLLAGAATRLARRWPALAPPRSRTTSNGHARGRQAAGSVGLMDFPHDPNDHCETPIEAVERLLRHEPFTRGCWDSSCGRGKIAKALNGGMKPRTGASRLLK
jgi:hypothetical protein